MNLINGNGAAVQTASYYSNLYFTKYKFGSFDIPLNILLTKESNARGTYPCSLFIASYQILPSPSLDPTWYSPPQLAGRAN